MQSTYQQDYGGGGYPPAPFACAQPGQQQQQPSTAAVSICANYPSVPAYYSQQDPPTQYPATPPAWTPHVQPNPLPPLRSQESSDRSFAQHLHEEDRRNAGGAGVVVVAGSMLRSDSAIAASLQHEENLRQHHNASGANVWAEEASPGKSEFLRITILDNISLNKVMHRLLKGAPAKKMLPRVNSLQPDMVDVISEDRQRLLTRLEMYSLEEKVVQGDGACQFRSLSDQLFGNPGHCDIVREVVVKQLNAYPDRYQAYVPDDYTHYCIEMSKAITWGDHVTLQAAADAYNMLIKVVTSFKEDCVIKIEPHVDNPTQPTNARMLYISFWAEVHYNSLYPKEDHQTVPMPHTIKEHSTSSPTNSDPGSLKDLGKPKKRVMGSRKLGKIADALNPF